MSFLQRCSEGRKRYRNPVLHRKDDTSGASPATRTSRPEVCRSDQLAKKLKKPGKQFGEPNYLRGVQEHEDARTSHPCERRARDRKAFFLAERELARQICKLAEIFILLRRCVMSSEERVKAELCAGSFSGCLVEGDAEENARERKIKRRAVGISVVVQSAALPVFVIAPLFAKPAELVEKMVVPIPPYRNSPAPRQPTPPSTEAAHIVRCLYCFDLRRIPPTVPTLEREDVQGEPEIPGSIANSTGNGNPYGIEMVDPRPQRPLIDDVPQ